mgnify:CR=1 FL=1
MPEGGLHIRWPDQATEQEFRLQQHKTSAALAFARTNRFNRITLNAQNCRFGIKITLHKTIHVYFDSIFKSA